MQTNDHKTHFEHNTVEIITINNIVYWNLLIECHHVKDTLEGRVEKGSLILIELV